MRAALLVNVFLLRFSSAINVPCQGAGGKGNLLKNENCNFSLGPLKGKPFLSPSLPSFLFVFGWIWFWRDTTANHLYKNLGIYSKKQFYRPLVKQITVNPEAVFSNGKHTGLILVQLPTCCVILNKWPNLSDLTLWLYQIKNESQTLHRPEISHNRPQLLTEVQWKPHDVIWDV